MVCTKVPGQSRHLGKGRGWWRPHSLSAGILQGFSHRTSPSPVPSTRSLPRDLRHPSGTLKNRHLYILVSWVAAAVCPEENGQRKTRRGSNDLGGISLHLQTLPWCRVFLLHQVQEGNLRWISKALLWAKRAYLDLYWGNSTVSILLFSSCISFLPPPDTAEVCPWHQGCGIHRFGTTELPVFAFPAPRTEPRCSWVTFSTAGWLTAAPRSPGNLRSQAEKPTPGLRGLIPQPHSSSPFRWDAKRCWKGEGEASGDTQPQPGTKSWWSWWQGWAGGREQVSRIWPYFCASWQQNN